MKHQPEGESSKVMSDTKLTDNRIKNFHKVTTYLYRGSQPSVDEFSSLKKLGVNTVVTFRWNKRLIELEAQHCEKNNLNLISIPLNYVNPPRVEDIVKFVRIIDDKDNHAVYVHCLHGVDRTGIMVAFYRIIRHNWTVDQAYKEMEVCGFHKYRLRPFKWKLFKFADYIAKHREEFEPFREDE